MSGPHWHVWKVGRKAVEDEISPPIDDRECAERWKVWSERCSEPDVVFAVRPCLEKECYARVLA